MGLFDWLRGDPGPPQTPVIPAAPTAADVLTALQDVRGGLDDGHAPALIRARVARIDALIQQTLPRLAHLGLGSADAYALVATATSYLPEALIGYLRLPRDWADTRPIDNGRTALLIVVDQLELLGATMEKVLDAATRSDAQALVAHARFLDAKFGHGMPDPAPGASAAAQGSADMAGGPGAPGPAGLSAASTATNTLDLE